MKFSWPFVFAVVPALILLVVFCSHDRYGFYNSFDSIYFVRVAKSLLRTLEQSSTGIDALKALYEGRAWKGSTISHITAFFLFLSGNDDLQTFFLFNLTFLGIFLVYAYLLFSLCLPAWSAAVVTLMVSTIPWVLYFALTLDTYLPFIAVTLVAIFHMVKSERFIDRRHSLVFGAAGAFCVCLRPLEMISNFGVPFFLFLSIFVVPKKYWAKSIFILTVPFVVTLLFGYLQTYDQLRYPTSIYFLLFALPAQLLPLIFYRRCGLPKNLALAYVIISVTANLWWLPFSMAFLSWAKGGAELYGAPQFFSRAHVFLFTYNLQVLGGIGLLFLLCLWLVQFLRKTAKGDPLARYLTLVLLYLVLGPLVIVSAFPTRDFNYLKLIYIYIWIVLPILTLRKHNSWRAITAALLLLAANQLWFISSLMKGQARTDKLASLIELQPYRHTVNFFPTSENPGPMYFDKLFNIISSEVEKQKPISIKIVRDTLIPASHVTDYLFNYISSEERNLPITFESISSETLKTKNCQKDSNCIRDWLRSTNYLMFEAFGYLKSVSSYFKQEKSCRLEFVGEIGAIQVERSWVGYHVFKRICEAG